MTAASRPERPPPDTSPIVDDALSRSTRRVASPPSRQALDRLYTRVHNYLGHLPRLNEIGDVPAMLAVAVQAISELYDVERFSIGRYNAERGAFEVMAAEFGRRGELLVQDQDLQGLIEEAARADRVTFLRISSGVTPRVRMHRDTDHPSVDLDTPTARLARALNAATLGIVPVAGGRGPLAVILMWLRDPEVAGRQLEGELLESLGKELAARADNVLTHNRLRHVGSLFDNILESVPQAIVAVGRDDRVTAVNSNAELLFGVRRIFAVGEPLAGAFPRHVADAFLSLTEQLLLQETSADAEIEIALPRGPALNIGISVSYLVDGQGRPQGYLFLCRDLSLSREVQKLRELDKMKSEFLSTVGHELKTPLTAILAGLELLGGELQGLSPTGGDLLEVVQSASRRLQQLILELLDLSRLESGAAQFKPAPCDLAELAHEALRRLPPHPSHEFRVEIEVGLPRVLLDRDKMLRALENYLVNAVKYSPRGGEIVLSVRQDGDAVAFSVTDRGIGISPENLAKLWQKFYRVDASYTAEIEGTGLGLVIVKKIAELHGGMVDVRSELGRGSTFAIRVPLRSVEHPMP